MIRAEDLIEFGYFRKHYHTVVDDRNVFQHSKDTINRMAKIAQEQGESGERVRDRMQLENLDLLRESEEFALQVIQVAANSFNERGLSLEQVREQYKSNPN